jgi:hypothetical protein
VAAYAGAAGAAALALAAGAFVWKRRLQFGVASPQQLDTKDVEAAESSLGRGSTSGSGFPSATGGRSALPLEEKEYAEQAAGPVFVSPLSSSAQPTGCVLCCNQAVHPGLVEPCWAERLTWQAFQHSKLHEAQRDANLELDPTACVLLPREALKQTGHRLGSGGSASVYLGLLSDKKVALKIFNEEWEEGRKRVVGGRLLWRLLPAPPLVTSLLKSRQARLIIAGPPSGWSTR